MCKMVAGTSDHAFGVQVATGGPANKRVVDMRSDTVTKPTDGMRRAIAEAEVGDDVFGDDPTIIELEKRIAKMLGKEAAVFVPSGTQGNLLAVATHCSGRGEEVICGKQSHVFVYEQGGVSHLMGVVMNTVANQPDGTLDLEEVKRVIKPVTPCGHFAVAKLLVLENTQNMLGGKVLPIEYMERAGKFCRENNLSMHVDGARLWNAAAKLGLPIADLVREADSVTVCLSKGLGCPVGSLLCGQAAFVAGARRLRKAVGGSMRQAGVLAAAGLYALDHHMDRLSDDHDNAQRLANGLSNLGLEVVHPDTNIVFWYMDGAMEIFDAMKKAGFTALCIDGQRRCRAVASLQVTAPDMDAFVAELRRLLAERGHEVPGQPAAKKAKSDSQ